MPEELELELKINRGHLQDESDIIMTENDFKLAIIKIHQPQLQKTLKEIFKNLIRKYDITKIK